MRPTQSELIDEINERLADGIISLETVKVFKKLRSHLADPWIPVEERLPTKDKPIVFRTETTRHIGRLSVVTGMWFDDYYGQYIGGVIAWLDLPPLPKKGE